MIKTASQPSDVGAATLAGLPQPSAPAPVSSYSPLGTLETLAAEIELVRRELYLGHWDEAGTTLARVRQRLVKVAEIAGAWSPDVASRLILIRAVAFALSGRVEDTTRNRGDWLFERAADLFVQVAQRDVAIADVERTDWAVALAYLGRFQEALNTLPPAPEDVAARADIAFALGRAYAKHGIIDEARRHLDCAAGLDEDDPQIHAELGRLRQDQGESAAAAKAFRAAARAFERQGRRAESQGLAERAIAADPQDAASHVLNVELLRTHGEPERALSKLDALPGNLRDGSKLLRSRATVLMDVGRHQDALAAADAAAAAGDASADLLLLKAFALIHLDRLQPALATIREAGRLDRENPLAHAMAARVQLALGDDYAALTEIERALEFAPNDPASHLLRASLLRQQGSVTEAVEAARAAVNLAPEARDANLELGRGLLASGRIEEARRALVAATAGKRNEVSAEAFALLGHAYTRLNRHEDAVKKLRIALRKEPALLDARDELAFALLELERPKEALRVIDETMVLALHDPPARRAQRLTWRGEALRLLKEFEAALRPLEEAYELAGDDVYTLGTLGQVRMALGDAAGAADVLLLAAQSTPPKQWVIAALVHVLADPSPGEAIAAVADAESRGLDRLEAVVLLREIDERGAHAARALDESLDARPDWIAALTARALTIIGDTPSIDERAAATALANADRMLELDPSWELAEAIKLVVLTALQRLPEARALVEEVLKRRPADEDFLQAKLSLILVEAGQGEAEAFLRDVIAMPGEVVWAYRELGGLLYEQGRADDALGVLDRALEVGGDEGTVQLALQVLDELERPKRAVALLRRAIDRNPDSAWLHGKLAERLWLRDKNTAALEEARASIELEPADAWTRALLGAILADLGRLIEALAEFDRALQIAPNDTWALGGKGHCLCELGEFREAIPHLSRALAAPDAQGWMRSLRAWARRHCGYQEAAFQDYEVAANGDKDDLWNRKGAATCLSFMEGRRTEAEPRFRELLERLENRSDIAASDRWSLTGWCAYRLEALDDAIDALTQAVTADPLEADVQFDLALVMLCAGHIRKAQAEYRRGLDLARPDAPRSGSLVRVALSDLREAGRERPMLAATREYRMVRQRLRESLAETRKVNATARREAAVV